MINSKMYYAVLQNKPYSSRLRGLAEACCVKPGKQFQASKNPRASHGPKLDLVTQFPAWLLGHGNPVDCPMDSATRNGCAALRVHRQPVPLGPSTGFPRRRPAAGKRSAFPTTGPFELAAAGVTDHVNLGPGIGLYCTIHSRQMESLSPPRPEPAGRNPACQLFGSRPPFGCFQEGPFLKPCLPCRPGPHPPQGDGCGPGAERNAGAGGQEKTRCRRISPGRPEGQGAQPKAAGRSRAAAKRRRGPGGAGRGVDWGRGGRNKHGLAATRWPGRPH